MQDYFGGDARGRETVSVGSTSAVMFANVPGPAARAFITTEGADVRYWVDGSDPTTTQGHLILAGGEIHLTSSSQVRRFKADGTHPATAGTNAIATIMDLSKLT